MFQLEQTQIIISTLRIDANVIQGLALEFCQASLFQSHENFAYFSKLEGPLRMSVELPMHSYVVAKKTS